MFDQIGNFFNRGLGVIQSGAEKLREGLGIYDEFRIRQTAAAAPINVPQQPTGILQQRYFGFSLGYLLVAGVLILILLRKQ